MWEAIFGLIGVVVGSGLVLGYNYYRDRREREEKYRVILYPKRLEVHQKALMWNYKLYSVLNVSIPTQDYEAVREVTVKAREWWESECLYLDEVSRQEMMVAINYVSVYIRWDREHGKPPPVWEQLDKAKKAIVSGIGMKHVEEPKKERPEGES